MISIITVTYNCVDVIEKTINSVLSQTYSNKEYIIIDGGSTDGTLDVIRKYQDEIDRFVSEPDNGVYDAMNKGIALAHGKWVNMMNAGDMFASSDVLTQIFSATISPNIAAIYSDYIMDFHKDQKIAIASVQEGDILHQALIYKKELHKKYGEYAVTKPLIASDFLFFCLIPEEKYLKVPYIIAKYDMTGLSNQGNWCYLQLASLRYIFHKITFRRFVKILVKEYIKMEIPSCIWAFYKNIKKIIVKS